MRKSVRRAAIDWTASVPLAGFLFIPSQWREEPPSKTRRASETLAVQSVNISGRFASLRISIVRQLFPNIDASVIVRKFYWSLQRFFV